MPEKQSNSPNHDAPMLPPIKVVETGENELGGQGFLLDMENGEAYAEVALDSDGTYFIEWVESDVEGEGNGTALFRKAKVHAKEVGALQVVSYLTSEGSIIAAGRAFGEEHILVDMRDEMRLRPGDEGFQGGELFETHTLIYPMENKT